MVSSRSLSYGRPTNDARGDSGTCTWLSARGDSAQNRPGAVTRARRYQRAVTRAQIRPGAVTQVRGYQRAAIRARVQQRATTQAQVRQPAQPVRADW